MGISLTVIGQYQVLFEINVSQIDDTQRSKFMSVIIHLKKNYFSRRSFTFKDRFLYLSIYYLSDCDLKHVIKFHIL